jgi:hypothetical protein
VSQPSVDSGCACNLDNGSSGYVVSVLFAFLLAVTHLRRSGAARRKRPSVLSQKYAVAPRA